ncbi:RNA ligase family protein [Chengkuizengella sediminis]|uniref:ATP-dependent DNA ligase n=1 Tax=Chengkuizengella sediminis TaxID=1885917 RepID=UPI0013894A57|nr:RNA ligase family protein [Chengkuizengella sediminis]NDI34719.1 DNA ligase [Chengkuizengella sediminis]
MTIQLPKKPMSPILNEQIPLGDEWGYQLKWDGVRILTFIQDGKVNLYSKKLTVKNDTYPEIVQLFSTSVFQSNLQTKEKDSILLDGEVIVFDQETQKPNFQKVLQREKNKSGIIQNKYPVSYVLFDLLYLDGIDWRKKTYMERYQKLKTLFNETTTSLFVTDLFDDGQVLWDWVNTHQWEGIVSKRLSSSYQEGKKHNDWFKKKTNLSFDVEIAAITTKGKLLSSLVMVREGYYFGKVSSGLNQQWKEALLLYSKLHQSNDPTFISLPIDLKGDHIVWLKKPFPCKVKGLEITSSGVLRHPQIEYIDINKLY